MPSTGGFTVLEILVVLIMIGILSAIAAPAWLAFVNRQRLATSQEALYRAMQSAQSNAKRDKRTWQVSIREVTTSGKPTVQWAVHPQQRGVFIPTGVQWNDLPPNVEVFKGKPTDLISLQPQPLMSFDKRQTRGIDGPRHGTSQIWENRPMAC